MRSHSKLLWHVRCRTPWCKAERIVKRFACLLVLWCGCVSFGTFIGQSEGEVAFADDADTNMARGEAAFKVSNYIDAAKYFEFVKTKYPFVEASKTAELRLADASFAQEKYVEARDRYFGFARIHPTHPQVDYAAWRGALTHAKDIPSDLFVLPPSTEKDQVEVKAALTAISDFVRMYPESSYVKEASQTLADIKRRLADHELAVADFYRNREKWLAVIGRLNLVLAKYQGVGYDERATAGLYEAHLKLKQPTQARAALEAFLATTPNASQTQWAKGLMARLPVDVTPAPAPTLVDAGTP
jgi:outer membrane protein assembly factor BamD